MQYLILAVTPGTTPIQWLCQKQFKPAKKSPPKRLPTLEPLTVSFATLSVAKSFILRSCWQLQPATHKQVTACVSRTFYIQTYRSLFIVEMDLKTVQQLRSHLGIPTEDLLLACNFCKKFLTFEELLGFDSKTLNLIWKEGYAYACCFNCARTVAKVEFEYFYEKTVKGREIESHSGSLLCCIIVRCQFCLRLLDYLEKLNICGYQENFYLVRGGWKGICRYCREI